MNRNFLQEAIADAKAVKESAIANAKVALEEAFSPQVQAMFASKLEEMEKDEEVNEAYDDVDEAKDDEISEKKEYMTKKEKREGDDRKSDNKAETKTEKMRKIDEDEEMNLDEILAELEKDEDLKENARTDAEEEGYKDGMKDEKEDLKEDERTDAEEEGYLDGEKDEKEDMEDKDDEEIDLEDMSEDDLKGFIEDVIKDMVADGEIEPGDEFEEVEDEDVDVEVEDEDVDVEIELDEAMSNPDMRHGMKGDNAEERKTEKMRFKEGEELDEMGDATVAAAAGGLENIIDSLKKLSKAAGPAAKKAYAALQALGAGAGAAMRNEEEDYAEMEELKKELQEVNLLNAKLLYTNKIFKAKNLSEGKKVKVLKAFDKATDVKQAKAIYETLNEGIVNTITNSKINESVKKGAASKASGLEPKATKQPILESNEVYDRMRKLAGLI